MDLVILVFTFALGFMGGICFAYQMVSESQRGKPATDISVLTAGRAYRICPLNGSPDMSWVVENKEGGERWVLALPIAEGRYKVVQRNGHTELETTMEEK